MSKVVAKILLDDPFGNPHTLLVKVSDEQVISYRLFGTISRIPMCLTNMQIKKPLPDLMLDFDSVEEMIGEVQVAVNSGTDTVTKTKIYV